MAVHNPPRWLDGAQHDAEGDRLLIDAIFGGETMGAGVVTRSDQMDVTQTATPTMSVLVAPGHAVIRGTEAVAQGAYFCSSLSAETLSITNGSAANDRIDLVVARVFDAEYSGATNLWQLDVIQGVPAGAPVAPDLPDNAIALAEVLVAQNESSSITNANITDVRNVLESNETVVAQVVTLQQAVTQAESNITTLDTAVGNNATAIDATNTTVTNLQTQVTNNENAQVYELITYTTDGTFTKATYPWAKSIRVRAVGGGGGSGGTVATTGSEVCGGGGGGGGSYAEGRLDISSLSASVTVTVGGGGAAASDGDESSFGTVVVAGGGIAGVVGTVQTGITAVFGAPGSGGTATAGDIQIPGSDATPGFSLGSNRLYGSDGGSGPLTGTQSRSVAGSGGASAIAGYLYGGGASGATAGGTQSAKAGAVGGDGIVIVEVFG